MDDKNKKWIPKKKKKEMTEEQINENKEDEES